MPALQDRRWFNDTQLHFDQHGQLPSAALTRLAQLGSDVLTPAGRIETRLLLGMAHRERDIPGMLDDLGRAWKLAAGSDLHRLIARREAARHLLAAGHARDALALLEEADALDDKHPRIVLTCKALAALARMDLGAGAAVAKDTRHLVPLAQSCASELTRRDRAWLVNDLLQLLLAQFWRVTGRPAALGARMSADDLSAPLELRKVLHDVLSWVTVQDLPACHEVHALCSLAQAEVGHGREALTSSMQALAKQMLSAATAELWLWLGVANRIAENRCRAIDCHRLALLMAEPTGAHRVTMLSSIELAELLAEQGDMQGAYEALCRCRSHEVRLQALSDLPMGGRWLDSNEIQASPFPAAEGQGPAALHVQKACLYIAAQVTRRTVTSDVAQACGVSRRTVELAFRSTMNCSVAQYLQRARLARITARLQLPGETVGAIAHDLGYTSITALGREFKRLTGQTVRAYRHTLGQRRLERTDG